MKPYLMENEYKELRYKSQINAFTKIVEPTLLKQSKCLLDLGCGSGLETVILQKTTGIPTIGIDVNPAFELDALKKVSLRQYNGDKLPFADNHFDGVYSYHVLEHVENLDQLLGELYRVLKRGGFAYIGVPNRSRMLAYFGVPGKKIHRMIGQNLVDFKDRFLGKFENELGAHAGFSETNLINRLKLYFNDVRVVTDKYYLLKWHNSKLLIPWFLKFGPQRFIWPSVYVLCMK